MNYLIADKGQSFQRDGHCTDGQLVSSSRSGSRLGYSLLLLRLDLLDGEVGDLVGGGELVGKGPSI